MRLRRRAEYQVAASCGGPSPAVSSGENHLNLAVVYVEGDVWTFLGEITVFGGIVVDEYTK